MEDNSLSVIINLPCNTNLNETAFFFLYTTFSQLFPFTEIIRGDKNDLISEKTYTRWRCYQHFTKVNMED